MSKILDVLIVLIQVKYVTQLLHIELVLMDIIGLMELPKEIVYHVYPLVVHAKMKLSVILVPVL